MRAQCSARSTSRPIRVSRSSPTAGTLSEATSMRTWCTDASTFASISWRSSEMIDTSPTSSSSHSASRSISAAVAPRPAKTPKLTRTSIAGGSCCSTTNAMFGSKSSISRTTVERRPWFRLTLPRLPAEASEGSNQADRAPQKHDRNRVPVRPQMTVADHDLARQPGEVRQRQHVRDRLEERRIGLRREERAGDDRHRQIDEVDDGGRPFRRSDVAGQAEAHRRETRGAEHQEHEQGEEPLRHRDVEEQPADRDHQRRLDQEDDERREEHREQIGRRRQRRRANALQDAALSADHHRDREARERRGGDAVADHPRLQKWRGANVLLRDRLVAVDRPEDQEEDDRQEEREERRLAVPPEEELRGSHLVQEEPHSVSSR